MVEAIVGAVGAVCAAVVAWASLPAPKVIVICPKCGARFVNTRRGALWAEATLHRLFGPHTPQDGVDPQEPVESAPAAPTGASGAS